LESSGLPSGLLGAFGRDMAAFPARPARPHVELDLGRPAILRTVSSLAAVGALGVSGVAGRGFTRSTAVGLPAATGLDLAPAGRGQSLAEERMQFLLGDCSLVRQVREETVEFLELGVSVAPLTAFLSCEAVNPFVACRVPIRDQFGPFSNSRA